MLKCECGRVKWAQDKVDWAQNLIGALPVCVEQVETRERGRDEGCPMDQRCEQLRLVRLQLGND